MTKGTANEIGRELSANELTPKTVVVLVKDGRPAITMWVSHVGEDYVRFYAGEIDMTFLAKRNSDGTLEDGSSIQFRVFEYLGEV